MKLHWRHQNPLDTQISKINLLKCCTTGMFLNISLTLLSIDKRIQINWIDLASVKAYNCNSSGYIHSLETFIS